MHCSKTNGEVSLRACCHVVNVSYKTAPITPKNNRESYFCLKILHYCFLADNFSVVYSNDLKLQSRVHNIYRRYKTQNIRIL